MLLRILADAVNAVSEWPLHCAYADDDPQSMSIGYRVGELGWRCPVTQVRSDIELIGRKDAQLKEMASWIQLPLRPYPEDQWEREVMVRSALLRCAVHIGNVDMRRQTASWITFLGRLRADPSGALLNGMAVPLLNSRY